MTSQIVKLCLYPIILTVLNTPIFAQHTWTGAVDSIWEKSGNWSPATIPTSSDDVLIPELAPGNPQPAVTTSSAVARTILLLDTLRILNNGKLAIDEGNGAGALSKIRLYAKLEEE